MAGDSATPLIRKLGIREGDVVAVVDSPPGFAEALGPLPYGAEARVSLRGRTVFNQVLIFVRNRAALGRRLPIVCARIDPAGAVWVAWPKKASGVVTDVTENSVRECALPLGLVDTKVCAIDEIWSGLRLVWRLEKRPLTKKILKKKMRK